MGILVAFAVGWIAGARTGKRDFSDLNSSLRALVGTDEFSDVVVAARSHVGHALRSFAEVVDPDDLATLSEVNEHDIVARVQSLFGRNQP
jgi:hypothetical protein